METHYNYMDDLLTFNDRSLQTSSTQIDINDHTSSSSSVYNPNITVSYDKISCMREFFFLHLAMNYIIFISGIVCFITRLLPNKYKFIHAWSGRIYVISMLWTTTSSLLINNTGLPLSTLILFGNVNIALALGWIIIVIYKERMNSQALDKVNKGITEGTATLGSKSLEQMVNEAKGDIVTSRSFKERLLSLKSLHGILFFSSWYSIAGRIFASNQSGDYTCHTYPVWKPINTPEFEGKDKDWTLVPEANPDYAELPWANGETAWSFMMLGLSYVAAILVGAGFCWFFARRDSKKRQQSMGIHPKNEDALSSQSLHSSLDDA